MKKGRKLALLLSLMMGVILNVQAQSVNALGLRIGGSNGFGPEISYQRMLKANTRLEIDLGLKDRRDFNAYKLTGLYQWILPMSTSINGYAGFGAGIGALDYNARFVNLEEEEAVPAFFDLQGVMGIEYSFVSKGIPLLLSLDINPSFLVWNKYEDRSFEMDVALGVKCIF